MAIEQDPDDYRYLVVVNAEEQYSVWRADLSVPDGWNTVGTDGTKAQCLAHIEKEWTDMRPRSLREAMASDPN